MKLPDGCAYFAHYHQMGPALTEKMEDMAYRYGRTYDAYLITEPNRQYFWSNQYKGVVGFRQIGRYVNLPGGLIAADEDKLRLLADLKKFARLNRLTISIYSVTDRDLGIFRQCGFQPTKLGEDAIVDLAPCDWKGKQYQWVRRQYNYCKRQGLVIKSISPQTCGRARWQQYEQEITHLSDLHLATKNQAAEMQLFEGQLAFEYLQRRRLFIAVNQNKQDRIEGFVILNPYDGGRGWAIEMYRYLPDAVRGVIPFLMLSVMNILKSEGVREVSLCIVPYLGCPQKIKGDSALGRNLIAFWSRHFNFVWDLKGLYHFKSRFRPRHSNLYACVYPRMTVGSIMAFNVALGALNLRPGKVLKNALIARNSGHAYAKPHQKAS